MKSDCCRLDGIFTGYHAAFNLQSYHKRELARALQNTIDGVLTHFTPLVGSESSFFPLLTHHRK